MALVPGYDERQTTTKINWFVYVCIASSDYRAKHLSKLIKKRRFADRLHDFQYN